ncbi:ATP-binding protein [Falsiroseomonas ponticola]|uniref:ATP-binding protein n=1 Tax=Falsiroseomonas ponticola TaxID=2786951 RepID=UPI0019335E70|nr:ATP-binding protein [Roseomonas ponticola]
MPHFFSITPVGDAAGTANAGRHAGGTRTLAAIGRIVAVLLLGLSVVGAWVLAYALSHQVMQAATAAGFDRARSIAIATGQVAGKTIEVTRMLRNLSQRWQSLGAPGDEARRRDVETTIRAILANPAMAIAQLGVAGPDGAVIWHSEGGHHSFSVADRAHFQQHRQGHPGPIFGLPNSGPGQLLPVSWRLTGPGDSFAGVAIALLRPEDVAPQLAAVTDQPTDVIALVRQEGELLAANQRGAPRIGTPVLPAPRRQDIERAGRFTATGPLVPDGPVRFVVAQLLPGTNLIAVAGVEAAGALHTARLLETASLLAALGYTGLAILCALLVRVADRGRRSAAQAALLAAGRAELHRLHARLPAVIFLRDVAADGSSRLTYRDGDVQAVTGWTDGSLDREEDWSRLYDEQAPARPEMVRQVLRDGGAIRRWRIRQPDGGWRDVVMHMQRLSVRPDGGGEIVGYMRDASAEQAALAREAAARAEMDETLALAPVVVFRGRVWACAGCQLPGKGCWREDFVSRSIEPVTGWTAAALAAAGGLGAILLPADSLVPGIEAMRRDGRWSADLAVRRPDGGAIAVRVTVSVVGRVDDSAMDIVGYLADVTAELDAKARAIAAARLASLGELSAGLAHELKQPLLAIGLALSNTRQALERGDLAAVGTRLGRASGYVTRAAAVVEHLRRFARGGEEGAAPEPVPLELAVEGAMAVLGGTLRDAGVQLVLALGNPVPRVLGQLVPLEQVLVNLIGNARDALAGLPADQPRRVRVSAAPDAGFVVLTVADNGGGIPDAVMARLFQPFVTTKAEDRGTGLGLSVCQGLVQQMGGTITATNEEGGAVFRIRLPAAGD